MLAFDIFCWCFCCCIAGPEVVPKRPKWVRSEVGGPKAAAPQEKKGNQAQKTMNVTYFILMCLHTTYAAISTTATMITSGLIEKLLGPLRF